MTCRIAASFAESIQGQVLAHSCPPMETSEGMLCTNDKRKIPRKAPLHGPCNALARAVHRLRNEGSDPRGGRSCATGLRWSRWRRSRYRRKIDSVGSVRRSHDSSRQPKERKAHAERSVPAGFHVCPETALAEAGATRDDVVKSVVFLSDIRYFEAMNEVQAEFFPQGKSARSTIRARLGRSEMSVEIEAVA